MLIANGAELPDETDFYDSPLLSSVRLRHPRLVKKLLEMGEDATAADENGWTALHQACMYKSNPKMIRMLIEAGADPGAVDSEGRKPEDYLNDDDIEKIKPLLEKSR